MHRQVNDAKDKWSVHARPTLTFDVYKFLRETNLTKCPESIVSNRLAKKFELYEMGVRDSEEGYGRQGKTP